MRPIITLLLPLLVLSCVAHTSVSDSGSPVAQELRAAGLAMADRGEVEQPFLAVKGRVYEVEGGDLQLYSYPSEEAARADAAKISPDGEISMVQVHWMAPPHFYRRGSTMAIYVGTSPGALTPLEQVLGVPFAVHR
jgi:hypothetical protein